MPPELVEEFPEGHKEAAERHEDSEDSTDWTEPMLLEMCMKENSRQDLRKSWDNSVFGPAACISGGG
jgi:hypothetical protein